MCHLPSGSRSLRCLARLAGVVACLASIHPVLQAAAPTQILLSDNIAYENSLPGDLVGLISAVDPDLADTHTFGLVPGAGAVSHDGFTITGNRLTLRYGVVNSVGVPLDFETQQTTFSIRVRATDPAGEFFEQAIVILMGDDRTEDADGDGLSEADEEDIHGTSDVVFDTDADGFGDGVEISGNSSPMNAAEWPDYPIVGWGDFRSGELRSDAGASGLLTISSGQSHNLGLKPDGTVVAEAREDAFVALGGEHAAMVTHSNRNEQG